MVIPMRHVTIFALSNRRRSALTQLREFGAMHIEAGNESGGTVSPLVERRYSQCKQALDIIKQYRLDHSRGAGRHLDAEYNPRLGEKLALRAVQLHNEIEEYKQQLFRIKRQLTQLQEWGEFDYKRILALSEHNIFLRFYTLSNKELEHADIQNCFIVRKSGRLAHVVVVDYKELQKIPYKEARLPEGDPLLLRQKRLSIELKIIERIEKLTSIARQYPHLHRAWKRIVELNELTTIRGAIRWTGKIIHINGFVPLHRIPALKRLAKQVGWGVAYREPNEDELTPSVLRTNPFTAMVRPIYRILGTLPGYNEPDFSLIFLLFFIVFFAMIVGDAGYAVLLMLTSTLLLLRSRRSRGGDGTGAKNSAAQEGGRLLLVVGAATFVWGALSGNWFGHQPIGQTPPLSYVVIPAINAFEPASIPFVQWLCFIIAAVHLTIAHGLRIANLVHTKQYRLIPAQIGWIALIFSLYALVVQLILGLYGYWYPQNFQGALIGGLIAIVLFGKQERGVSIFKGMAKGAAGIFSTVLDSISAFADVVSYLRLFAVGLASVEIARSFNLIAASLSDSSWGIVAAVLLIALGHSLNLAMGALSLIVHGVRLNMLEFSSHIGVEWSGIVYRPFRRSMVEN